MIYPHFKIEHLVGKPVQTYSGMDHPDRVVRKNSTHNAMGIDRRRHFEEFPHKISYEYNSRGFRDVEWPEDIQNTPVIFGDSFIVGIGQPVEHRTSNLLGAVNVAMDGASNDWLARRGSEYIRMIRPLRAAVQWSYVSRREDADVTGNDLSRRRPHFEVEDMQDHIDNLVKNVKIIEAEAVENGTDLVHSFIPGYTGQPMSGDYRTMLQIQPLVRKLCDYQEILDYARDAHHYGEQTARGYAEEILRLWQN